MALKALQSAQEVAEVALKALQCVQEVTKVVPKALQCTQKVTKMTLKALQCVQKIARVALKVLKPKPTNMQEFHSQPTPQWGIIHYSDDPQMCRNYIVRLPFSGELHLPN